MALSAQVVVELIAAGLQGADLAAACKRIEDAEIPLRTVRTSTDRRREWDRKRKAEKRAKSANSTAEKVDIPPDKAEIHGGQAVPPTALASAEMSAFPPDKADLGGRGESSFLPSLRDSGKKDLEIQHAREKRDRGTRLPDDWQPNDGHWSRAVELGVDERYDRHVEEFKNHWRSTPGSRGRKINWDMTFTNRLIQIAEYKSQRNQTNGYNTRDSLGQAFAHIDRREARKNGGSENLELLPGLRETFP